MSIEAPSMGIETASVGMSEAVAAPSSLPAATAPSFEAGPPRLGEAGGFHNAEANFSILADTVAYAPDFSSFNTDRLASFDAGTFETIWSAPEASSSFDSFSVESAIAEAEGIMAGGNTVTEAENIISEANSMNSFGGILSEGKETTLSYSPQAENIETFFEQVESVDALVESLAQPIADTKTFEAEVDEVEMSIEPEIGLFETSLFETNPEAQIDLEAESLLQTYTEDVLTQSKKIAPDEELSPFIDYKTSVLEGLTEGQRNEVKEEEFAQAAVVVEAMQAVGDTKTEAEEKVVPIVAAVLEKKGIVKEKEPVQPGVQDEEEGVYVRDEKANQEREEIALNAFKEVLEEENIGSDVGYEIAERLPSIPEPDPVRSQVLKDRPFTKYRPDGSYVEFVYGIAQIKARTIEEVREEIKGIILNKPAVKYDSATNQNEVSEKDVRRVFRGEAS